MKSWHNMTAAASAAALETDLERGLTASEAQTRLRHHGPNELTGQEGVPLWRKIVAQFQDFLVLILLAAGAISFILGERADAVLIFVIVILNAVLGLVQEGRAQKALQALKQMAVPRAIAVRDGQPTSIAAKDIVPGDIIIIDTGSVLPCDVRLFDTASLRMEEAALTGESAPVEKDAKSVLAQEMSLGDRVNMAFMGTTAVYGRGTGIAVATGMDTAMGRIAHLLKDTDSSPTPLQQRLNTLGRVLGLATIGICAVIFATGVMLGEPNLANILDMFLVAVSLAVAAIPEGLPAVVTIVLALGMKRMASQSAILKSLHAVETLGSTTVICTDKTGTLTQNKMAALSLWVGGHIYQVEGQAYTADGSIRAQGEDIKPASGSDLELALMAAALCNDARVTNHEDRAELIGDPTEGALLGLAAKGGIDAGHLQQDLPRIAELPFDSQRKLMSTVHLDPQESCLAVTKGAPDVVLQRSSRLLRDGAEISLTADIKNSILDQNAVFSEQALRVIALAYRRLGSDIPDGSLDYIEDDLVFLGLVGIRDPLREESAGAIAECHQAGIRTIMITGDHPTTAHAIGRELGLADGTGVLTGQEIAALTDEQLAEKVQTVNIYARVAPEHKSAIVRQLQGLGHIVAVTGDGVNDAPALKQADIGVAMGITGTDVAKGAADMILTDDNFASIVRAVKEGRVIYTNIRKFVYFLLSCNVGEVLIVLLAQLMGLPLPLLPVHLLWLNLLTDALPALALGVERPEPGIMDRPPRSPDEPLMDRPMISGIATQSVLLAAAVLTVFHLALKTSSLATARTMAFTTLVLAELFRSFTSRSETNTILQLGIFSNPSLLLGVGVSAGLFLLTLYAPPLEAIFHTTRISWSRWALILPAALLPAVASEIKKLWLQRKRAQA